MYNYYEEMEQDIRDYIEENIDLSEYVNKREKLEEELYENFWMNDSITGNASGSYTFSTYEAEENLCHNLDLLQEALNEFGFDFIEYLSENGAEACDVSIRCYLLATILHEVLDEFENEGLFDENEEDD